jgi:glutathione S-transferase
MENKTSTKPILGYWAIRGLAQPIRLLLEYAGIEYTDKRYVCGDASTKFNREQWTSEKHKLGLDFPNLPYWIDSDVKLTQSAAILHHVARKAKLTATEDKQKAILEMIEGAVVDIRSDFVDACYDSEHWEQKFKDHAAGLQERLKVLDSWLNKKAWVGGDKLSYVDFLLYELLDQHSIAFPRCLEPLQNLSAFVKSFEALPAIAKYLKSSSYMNRPLNNPQASFK